MQLFQNSKKKINVDKNKSCFNIKHICTQSIKETMMKQRWPTMLVTFMSFFSAQVLSQEHHYWTNQFGSRAALMSGAIVGGVRDTSAGFYNPGALGFLKASTFSASGNGYQLESVDINNGAGTGVDVDSSNTNIIPLLISGTFALGNNTFGYSLLAKNQSSIKLSGRHEESAFAGLDSNPNFAFNPSTGEPAACSMVLKPIEGNLLMTAK